MDRADFKKGISFLQTNSPQSQIQFSHQKQEKGNPHLYTLSLTIGALGVVFGDIGTSPLYALRECFYGAHAIPLNTANVLGILSLIFWSLIIVISMKYLLFVMKADNRGEGGVLALMALANPRTKLAQKDPKKILIYFGLFGAALLYGDGIITPAITVLSAVEGLGVVTHFFEPYIIPITMVIFFFLFYPQKFGTAKIGRFFGPLIILWFITISILGIKGILLKPSVFAAISPHFASHFFINNGWHGFIILGSVFLVVTGGEALYADMGHFGRKPIRLGWFYVVLPALLLNYFGQGALLLTDPSAVINPFYRLAPAWFLYPLVVIASLAAVVASQALISGAYSITKQAIQLGFLPRQQINHTSEDEIGQIYVPMINNALFLSTVALVFLFRSSSNLAAAYGIAVTTTMVITTILIYFVAKDRWGWSPLMTGFMAGIFLFVDGAFFVANVLKIHNGGWFPLLVGAVIFTGMTTWRKGRFILAQRLKERSVPLKVFTSNITREPPLKIGGTAVFMTSTLDGTPPALIHNIKHNKVIHEKTVILTVVIEDIPHIVREERYSLGKVFEGIFMMHIHYGFMDTPNVPAVLARCQSPEMTFRLSEVTYFLGNETIIASKKPGMAIWREKLFSFMSKNAQKATSYFKLPPEQVVEIGIQIEI